MSSISHPQHKCNHEENRFKVCAPCGRKIKFGSSKPSEFNITGKLAFVVHVVGFSVTEIWIYQMQRGLFQTCLTMKIRQKKQEQVHALVISGSLLGQPAIQKLYKGEHIP
ncbi:PREDICTED: uncharacterized protein LOC108370259 isoform X2 [Rhagoletis zephyria]|uniref:uncharacterized protein LOC108363812 n=1 Tax=Rhagoletis zephyria TaxID=28612 RepID=UPI0008114C29|nr:PREDICTED: uncharacterized protein LOC108363064 isoform X2 [Rhagoletis zephyria]XP_017472790.1 PREDICTED: uncharacterized protein LOC108363812 [Rhagoletis zephyria]XP_017476165.1 PREDICTED: uncharacterized protein LOC108366320 isoform X2 [Rhagoletis zephyria]XP_017477077.1 PREDICTED: uncharacterized protein LOC108367065 isoform X2 [Rhagoletis zephyria]XP_017481012.1 PREDICTED: uncharacterized protein LOC108370232 [Rhagoletis zephyria]XP_017481049.1 PREDICTED: uncharacterized protein LOC1083